MATGPPPIRENIIYDKDGNAYIAGSQRPDGSWRKARKIKDGYIPQDEVPVYQSKGKKEALEVSKMPPAGLSFVDDSLNTPLTSSSETKIGMTKAQKKNAQKRQKKKEKRQKEIGFEIEEVIEGLEHTSVSSDIPSKPMVSTPSVPDHEQSDKEQAKRIRTLGKKLHQIEELERKIASGEIPKPDKDQLRKITNKQQLLEEMESLQLTK